MKTTLVVFLFLFVAWANAASAPPSVSTVSISVSTSFSGTGSKTGSSSNSGSASTSTSGSPSGTISGTGSSSGTGSISISLSGTTSATSAATPSPRNNIVNGIIVGGVVNLKVGTEAGNQRPGYVGLVAGFGPVSDANSLPVQFTSCTSWQWTIWLALNPNQKRNVAATGPEIDFSGLQPGSDYVAFASCLAPTPFAFNTVSLTTNANTPNCITNIFFSGGAGAYILHYSPGKNAQLQFVRIRATGAVRKSLRGTRTIRNGGVVRAFPGSRVFLFVKCRGAKRLYRFSTLLS